MVLVLTLGAGCADSTQAPRQLVDGSEAVAPSVELEGQSSPAVLTKLRVLAVRDVQPRSLADACLRGPARGVRPLGSIVERVSVYGESVTLRDTRGLYGCDESSGPREGRRLWCGSSFGNLYGGRLRDPRLDMAACTSADGQRAATAWIESGADTAYVVLDQQGFAEAYETAGGVAVRVATISGFHDDPLSVTFRVSEHDAEGKLLRRYDLDAFPAG